MHLRVFRRVCAASVASLVLVACGTDDTADPDAAPDDTAASDDLDEADDGDVDAEPAPEGAISVLTYWEEDHDAMAPWLDICREQTGQEFAVMSVPQDELIPTAGRLTATGDAPGIILPDNQHVPSLAEADVLAPLDLEALGLSEDDFQPGPFSAGTHEGEQYSLPVGSNGEVIIYNVEMLEEADVDVPSSWDELSAAAEALTTDEVYGWGVTLAAGETATWNWVPQLWSNGGSLTDLTSPEAVEAMDWYTSFVREGTSPEATLGWDSTDLMGQFLDEQLAMIQMGTWWLPTLMEDAEERGIEFGQAPQVSPDGSPPEVAFGGEVLALGLGLDDEAREVANECIGYWFEPENQVEFAQAVGYVPNLLEVRDEFLEDNPHLETLSVMLDNSRSRTDEVGSRYNQISPAIAAALQEVAGGQRSAEEALADAEAQAQ